MSIDISRLGPAAQKQILKKLREAEAAKIAKQDAEKKGPMKASAPTGTKERIATGGAAALAMTGKNGNKLHAEKTEDGYASKREAARAAELKLMQAAGEIYNLREQVKYVLVPAIYQKPDGTLVKNYDLAKHKRDVEREQGCKLELLERCVWYAADFVYEKDGQTVVEDAKGFKKTNAAAYEKFVHKRKLMLHVYGIRVREV